MRVEIAGLVDEPAVRPDCHELWMQKPIQRLDITGTHGRLQRPLLAAARSGASSRMRLSVSRSALTRSRATAPHERESPGAGSDAQIVQRYRVAA